MLEIEKKRTPVAFRSAVAARTEALTLTHGRRELSFAPRSENDRPQRDFLFSGICISSRRFRLLASISSRHLNDHKKSERASEILVTRSTLSLNLFLHFNNRLLCPPRHSVAQCRCRREKTVISSPNCNYHCSPSCSSRVFGARSASGSHRIVSICTLLICATTFLS